MQFISDKERTKRLTAIHKTTTGRKFLVIITLILFMAINALVWLSVAMQVIKDDSNAWYCIAKFVNNQFNLTIYGWILFVVTCLTFLFAICSIFAIASIKQPKNVVKEINHLARTPLSGKKTTGSAMKDAKNRLKKPTKKSKK